MSRRQRSFKEMMDTALDAKQPGSTDADWRDSSTAGQCLSHLCLSDHLSDINFTFKGHLNVRLPAHRFVLSMRSSVFEAMFHGPLAEVGKTVEIKDIRPETMKVLLRFVYSDNPELDENNVLPSLYGAQKYALMGLVKQCSDFLENNLDSDNVCAIFEQAILYNMKFLETKCLDFILENTSDVFVSQGFLEVSHATLLNMFKHDELTIDEVKVFIAAIKWSQQDSESQNITPDARRMREILGEALFAIRFPTMSIVDFAKVVSPVGILTSEEQVMLYQYIATGGSTPLDKFPENARVGKIATVDVSSLMSFPADQHNGYHLHIADQYNIEEPQNTRNLRVISVTGAFVKHVKTITCENDGINLNYKIDGNKIVFQKPVEITEDVLFISFNTEDATPKTNKPRRRPSKATSRRNVCKTANATSSDTGSNPHVSYDTAIDQEVHDRYIYISRIPGGMQTISFIK